MHSLRIKRFLTGFTLIEMLIVTVILSVVSLAVYSALSNGVKAWNRIYNKQVIEEDINIFLNKFSHDLRNSLFFSHIAFSGKKDSLEFAALLSARGFAHTAIGRVSYTYAMEAENIERAQYDFSQVFTEKKSAASHSLKNIKSLKFQYYRYIPEDKEYLWEDEWTDAAGLPIAVKIEAEYNNGAYHSAFSKTVSIPIGG